MPRVENGEVYVYKSDYMKNNNKSSKSAQLYFNNLVEKGVLEVEFYDSKGRTWSSLSDVIRESTLDVDDTFVRYRVL